MCSSRQVVPEGAADEAQARESAHRNVKRFPKCLKGHWLFTIRKWPTIVVVDAPILPAVGSVLPSRQIWAPLSVAPLKMSRPRPEFYNPLDPRYVTILYGHSHAHDDICACLQSNCDKSWDLGWCGARSALLCPVCVRTSQLSLLSRKGIHSRERWCCAAT